MSTSLVERLAEVEDALDRAGGLPVVLEDRVIDAEGEVVEGTERTIMLEVGPP